MVKRNFMEVAMNISSENIQKKEFHIVFKGYKPEEVDKFLDMLAIEFEKIRKKVEELEEGMDSLKYEGDKESVKMKRVIQEALVSAHKVAEEIKQKAKTEAEELINSRRLEEEEAIRKIRSEKEMLQQSVARLKEDYTAFKMQISKFADDFKQKTLSLGDVRLDDTIKKIDLASEKIGIDETLPMDTDEIDTEDNSIEDTMPEDREVSDNSRSDLNEFKHAKKEEIEDIEDVSGQSASTIPDDIIEKMKYQDIGNLKGETEEKDNENGVLDKAEDKDSEKEEKEESEKKIRKKIDIANPDIINDFFKTDED